MTITESKLKTGSLMLGTPGVEFGCQPTNVRLEPSPEDVGDAVETLCGDQLAAEVKTTWSMMGTSIQDFDDVDGFVWYTYENDLETVAFTWTPNETAEVISGNVQVRAVVIGGDVNVRLTSDFEWPIVGDLTRTAPVVGMTAAQAEPAPASSSSSSDSGPLVDQPA